MPPEQEHSKGDTPDVAPWEDEALDAAIDNRVKAKANSKLAASKLADESMAPPEKPHGMA